MNLRLKFMTAFLLLFILSNTVPALTVKAVSLPEESLTTQDTAPEEAFAFHANIESSVQGYVVKGEFTDFPADTSFVQPLYSLDGETYQPCDIEWDLHYLGTDDARELKKLQNQVCLYSNFEPLKSYLAEEIDFFYLKLRITTESGISHETQTAVIDRGSLRPLPEGITAAVRFAPAMNVLQRHPFRYFGKYQLTVSENATSEDIFGFLPDTLPVEIVLLQENEALFAQCIVDCPVTWKSFTLPSLTAGETITIEDAAEEMVIPGGTILHTPLGIFQLDEPLKFDEELLTDEVLLALNVISEKEAPSGMLSMEYIGLEIAFDLKPTGATAIHTYVISQGETEWRKLSDVSLLEAVNAQPSTSGSGYALILGNDSELVQSYLAAINEDDTPVPFLIGLKIQGGVYDDSELVLSWPDTYDLPLDLPSFGGSGGNEGNAGSTNKGDSTAEGQRPNLPSNPETKPETPVQDSDMAQSDNMVPSDDTAPSGSNTQPVDSAQTTAAAQPDNTAPSDNTAQTDTATQPVDTVQTAAAAQPDNSAQTAAAAQPDNSAQTAAAAQPDNSAQAAAATQPDNTVRFAAMAQSPIMTAAIVFSPKENNTRHNALLPTISAAVAAGIVIMAVFGKTTANHSLGKVMKKIYSALRNALHRPFS